MVKWRDNIMETIGIRELKENLGHYMDRVRTGEKITITDRKKEIAVIIPLGKKDKEEKIYQLIQRGIASWQGGKPKGLPARIVSKGKSVSDAVIEDRR
jgi:prevent-host-death family protein